MRRIFALLITVILMTGLTACTPSTQVASPDGSIQVAVQMDEGQPHYRVARNGKTVLEPSPLGIQLQDAPPMTDEFEVTGVSHTLTLPFTRMVAGPLDYTPGIFRLTGDDYTPGHRVYTTLSKQLANMVVLYSPMQMAADLIENYEGHDAFQFIERVPADWGESHVLNARIGESITIARRERGSARWFVGSTTNKEARELDVPLSLLEDGQTYVAHVFEDVPDQDYETNPQAYRIRRVLVTSDDTLTADLGRSGGQAVVLVPATDDDMQRYETLGE